MMFRGAGHIRLALIVLAAASPLVGAGGAAAASVEGFSVRPAHFDPAKPETRAYFEKTIRPAASLRDQVIVTNNGHSPVELRIYPVDGVTAVTSGAVYTNRGVRLRKAGRWITPARPMLRVPGGGHAVVGFTVHVPAGTPAGDHLAGLAFEDAHPHRSGGRFSVTEVIRAVVGIAISVPGPASPQIQLQGLSLKALPGTQVPSTVVRLTDTGLKMCKPSLAVSLAGSGERAQTVTRHLDTLLPGDVIPFPLRWPRALHAGTYAARAVATGCGKRRVLRATVALHSRLAGTTADPQKLAPVPSKPGNMPPGLLMVVGLSGIALGSLGAWRLGRRKSSAAA